MAQRGRPPHPGPLTPAEARVLEHVREGLPSWWGRRRWAVRPILLVLATASLIASAACGGDDEATPAETAAPTVTATATIDATSTGGDPLEVPPLKTFEEFQASGLATGLPELVVEVIEAALADDIAAIEDLVSWEMRPCATNWTSGPPSPPQCGEDRPDGT